MFQSNGVKFYSDFDPHIHILFIEYADNIHLSDCRFIENKGTPIAVYDSNFTVFDTLIFVNTGYQGGAC